MWDLFIGSVKLFVRGHLFADQKMAFRQIMLGIITVTVLVIGVKLAGAPLWCATIVGGAIGGALAPVFCINLRMK